MTNRALVIGIDNYPPDPHYPTGPLLSCVNDAWAIQGMLCQSYAFSSADINVLPNEQASIVAIRAAIDKLFSGATNSDRLVLYFSGHGSTYSLNGNAVEALVSQDLGYYNSTDLINSMRSLPLGILTVVVDACYAAAVERYIVAGSRNIAVNRVKSWMPAAEARTSSISSSARMNNKYYPFGFGIAPSTGTVTAHFSLSSVRSTNAISSVVSLEDPSSKGLLVASSLSNELSSASVEGTDGLSAFTFALTRAIAESGPVISTASLVDIASRKLIDLLAGQGTTQHPMIKEPTDPPHLSARAFISLNPMDDEVA
jgi:hypothetical protein